MKKIIIGLVIIAVIIGIGYVFTSYKKNSNENIYLFVESGKVFINEQTGQTAISSAPRLVSEKKIVVSSGSYIKTEGGLAHVLFPDNSMISLGENSGIEVKYTKENVSVFQMFGDTYSRVEKLASGNTYEVKTSGTIAAVRGTKFAVRYDPKTKVAKVAVTENKVKVSRVEATSTEPVDISVDMLANVDEKINPALLKGLIKVSPTKDDTEMNEWLKRNALLDKYTGDERRNILEKLIKTEEGDSSIESLRARLEKLNETSKEESPKSGELKKTTMKALLSMGGSQKCNYSYHANGMISSSVVYLSKGKMRADSNTTVSGKNIESHMIMMNDTSYVWGDGMPQGIKIAVNNTAIENSQYKNQTESFDMSKEMDYSCENHPSDDSLFQLPSGIKFLDMSEMMKQAMPTNLKTSTGGSVDICGSCTNLPEPSRTQCRTALGCK